MRLLLDAHLSPTIAAQLNARGIEAVPLRDWQGGRHANSTDEEILTAAKTAGWVLVTYDQQTIPPLLKAWAETAQHHAGVVLVDGKTLAANNVGGLVRALQALAVSAGHDDWHDRVKFLRRRP